MKARYLLVLFALLVALPQAMNAKKKKEVSIQLYSVRDVINKGTDLNVVLKDLAEMGYTSIEAANYDNGKFYGKTPEEFKSAVEKAGMTVLSSHCSRGLSGEEVASGDFSESLKWWDQSIAAHKAAGMKYIVNPGIGVPKTMKEMKMYCDYFNTVGYKTAAASIAFGYHNHAFEFRKIGDQLIYDFLLDNVSPNHVFFEMDVYWVQEGGGDPVAYLKNRPSQFKAVHIKDEKEIGASGKMNFKPIFDQMYANNIKDWYVEVEQYTQNDPVASVQQSYDYLNKADYVK